MEKDYFINSGIPPPLQFEPTMPFPSWNTNWDHHSSDHQFNPFNSTLNSIASNNFNDNNNTNNSTNNSCYTTRINSPPNLHIPSMMGKDNLLNLESSLNPLSTDPGFAQRAAKFSCFGSRSFNGRTTSPLGLYNNAELSQRSTQQFKNGKLPRVSSSPALKQSGSLLQIKNLSKLTSSNESGSEPSGETGSKTPPTELNSRKRKSVSRVKTKHDSPANGNMGGEVDDSARAKRCKQVPEGNQTENGIVNMEESKDNEDEKEAKPEPPKDYIHVRARRGQATDSHSLAERVRREKISERMKLLQDLVPGCNKVTGKALMLDEIINYVQSLQRQVEFLSMKLSSVNSSLDFPEENLLSKDICQPNGSIPQPVLPSYQQPRQPSQLHTDIPNGALSQCSVDTLDASLCRSLGLQLPSLDGFGEYLNQFPTMCEDDLQSIVQMGFTQNPNKDLALPSQGFPGKEEECLIRHLT